MKNYLKIIIIAGMTFCMSYGVFASESTDKYIAGLKQERCRLVEKIVSAYLGGKSDDRLEELIVRLVDSEVKIRFFEQYDEGAMLPSVKAGNEPLSRREIAGAITRKYYEKKGLKVNLRKSFRKIYVIIPNK